MIDYEYIFPTQVMSVVDGDTLDVRLDLGFEIYTVERVRLADVDTSEVYSVEKGSQEYKRGKIHSEETRRWVETARSEYDDDWPFVLYSEEYERGAYGRIIGRLEAKHSRVNLGRHLQSEFDDVS